MRSADFVARFPEKVSDTLESLYIRLLKSGFSEDLIQKLRDSSKDLLLLEDEINRLKIIFEKHEGLEISDDDIGQLGHIFSLVEKVNKGLNGVIFTADHNATLNQFNQIINSEFGGNVSEAGYERTKSVVLKSWVERIRLKYALLETSNVLEQSERSGTLKDAIDLADRWIKTQEELTKLIQDKRKLDFLSKANEHSSEKRCIWIISAVLLASCAGSIFYWALKTIELTTPKSILLAVVSSMLFYLTWFCLNQYNMQVQLYEAYKFRAIIIEMSSVLASTYREHEAEVFKKSMDVIYSEPTVSIFSSGKNNVDADLKKFFMDVVKSRVIGSE